MTRYRGCWEFDVDFLLDGGMCDGFRGVHMNALEILYPVTPFSGLESDCVPRYGALNVVSALPARCCGPNICSGGPSVFLLCAGQYLFLRQLPVS